jgi:hypothetical protein
MKCVGPLNLVASRLALKIYQMPRGKKAQMATGFGQPPIYSIKSGVA